VEISMTSNPALNWEDLRYYLATVEAGSFSEAAMRLGVNRTTVSRRIRSLEQALDEELLGTEGRPTEAGRKVLEAASTIAQQLEQLHRGGSREPSGRLRVAAPQGLGAEFMPQLGRFCETYATVKLELVSDSDPELALLQRRADVAIAVSNHPAEPLRGSLLGELRRAPYASQTYLQHHAAANRLAQHRWIGWGKSMSHTLVAKWMQANLPEDAVATEVNSWTSLREATRQGLGVAWMWCFLADDIPDLQPIRPPSPPLSMGLWLLHHEDIPPTPAAEAFLQHIAPILQRRIAVPS
jgi:DNA-binding transcriptional LysR family regulator